MEAARFIEPWKHEFLRDIRTGLLERQGYERYQPDPVGFSRDILGDTLWNKQEEILRSVWENKKTAVQSANNIGKTFIASRAAIAWLNVFEDSKVITTAAPPERQIKDLLWGEMRGAYRSLRKRGVRLIGDDPGSMIIRVNDNWWDG